MQRKSKSLTVSETGELKVRETHSFAQFTTDFGEWVYQIMHYCREQRIQPQDLIESHRNRQNGAQ